MSSLRSTCFSRRPAGLIIAGIASLLVLTGEIRAETTTPQKPDWPSVTPKRISVPARGVSKRITIQIKPGDNDWFNNVAPIEPQPSPQEAETPQVQPVAPRVAKQGEYDWFWNSVPHDMAGAGPHRFVQALAALDASGAAEVRAPSFQSVTDIARKHGREILAATIGTKVSPALAIAVISVESSGRADAVSHAGAQGLMQLIPATASRFGVKNALDPRDNIKGGVTYLDWLLNEFRGDVALALAGYNAGENAVKKNDGPPPYPETLAYVPKVLAAWNVAKGLCLTPPELYSDGCVFATQAVATR